MGHGERTNARASERKANLMARDIRRRGREASLAGARRHGPARREASRGCPAGIPRGRGGHPLATDGAERSGAERSARRCTTAAPVVVAEAGPAGRSVAGRPRRGRAGGESGSASGSGRGSSDATPRAAQPRTILSLAALDALYLLCNTRDQRLTIFMPIPEPRVRVW
ncbi:Protein of unknown function [Gryllus bimaculatus]|nr:Protein of unknown function [Gryllus bimaculatus]